MRDKTSRGLTALPLVRALAELAGRSGDTNLLDMREHDKYGLYLKEVNKSK